MFEIDKLAGSDVSIGDHLCLLIFRMKKGADKLTIRELFSAAGVRSLEQVSDALNAKGKTYRRHGLVLHVTIKYTNTDGNWFGTG